MLSREMRTPITELTKLSLAEAADWTETVHRNPAPPPFIM